MSTASGQGPDLSRIVNLIMQNPDLIRQIENLAKQNTEETNEGLAENEVAAAPVDAPAEETQAISVQAMARNADKREKRSHLLSALRPYVSEKRGKTIDTLLGAMDLWDLVSGG